MNTEKTLINSLVSVIAQVIILLLKFINRRVFIYFLDIEYLGYQTLFENVFSLLSIAELGIGNIISFHLYKEVAVNNEDEIGKLMYLYKWLYRIVAFLVLIMGLLLYFLLPLLVKDAKASWDYLYLIYFIQLISVVGGYFLSYKRTIYIATQQEYKCVQADLVANIIIQILQLSLLAIFRNYILYLILQVSIMIVGNIIISRKANKEFSFINKKYEISIEYIKAKNMFSDLRNFLVHQFAYAIYGGTDNIIISAFCGVRNVALYGNYVLIQKGLLNILFYKLLNPVQATIGNIVYGQRSKNELWEQFKTLDLFSFFFATYIGLGFWIFFQPFISIWMGSEYLLPTLFVGLFSVTIYLGAVFEMVYKYRTVFGDYKQDRNMMILSAVLNIVASISAVKVLGIPGVQLGTLIAFIPIAYGRIRFVVANYFGKSLCQYILKHFLLLIVALLEGILCYLLCKGMSVSIIGLLSRGIVWFFVPLIVNVSLFFRNPYFKHLLEYGQRLIGISKSKLLKRE